MGALFSVILPVFVVIGYGYVASWRGWMSDGAVDAIMKFSQSFALPVLLFQSIATLDLGSDFDPRLMLAFYTGAFASFALGWLAARRIFGRTPEEAVAIGFVCLFSNSLLLGLPITERAYGPEALTGNYTILAIHSPIMYTFGITFMEFTLARGKQMPVGRVALRALTGVLRTPLVMGIIAGFAVNALTAAGLVLPQGLWDAVSMIARAALPAALFGLGGVLMRYRPTGDVGLIAVCCACSLLLHPGITYGLGKLLGLDVAGLRSGVMTAAMPPGVNAFMFASMYATGQRVAASSVLVATFLAVGSIWLWLAVLP